MYLVNESDYNKYFKDKFVTGGRKKQRPKFAASNDHDVLVRSLKNVQYKQSRIPSGVFKRYR